jgi:membrane protein implicated in regulation of membrane protease activity
MFLVLALLLLIFVPWPWALLAALASLLLFVLEVAYWYRRMRTHRVRTGVEDLVGATGEVTAPLAPRGQIRVKGELWEAHSQSPVDRGARVRVVAVEGLTLEVTPSPEGASPNGPKAIWSGALVVVAAFLLAGCGGDSEPSASESYANSVCSDVSTWVTSIQDTTRSIQDQGLSLTKSDIESAVNDVSDSTQTLVDDVKGLGAPDTEDGQKAETALDGLGTQLTQQVDTVKQAVNSNQGTLALATTVTAAVSAGTKAVETTYNNLKNLDPAGELSDAFKNSDDCKSLEDQIENIRS